MVILMERSLWTEKFLTSTTKLNGAMCEAHCGEGSHCDRLRVGWGTARAEDARGTPSQSQMSPSKLVYEENWLMVVPMRARAEGS